MTYIALQNLYFRNNKAPRTVKIENKNFLLRTKKYKWIMMLTEYKQSAMKNIIRDYPKKCPNGIQKININDKITKSILSKL